MSSKKALRRQRREKQQEQQHRRGLSSVTIFMLCIGAAVLLAVVVGLALGVNSGQGDPPRAGAVWSDAHGHWH